MGEDFTDRVATEVRAEMARKRISQETLSSRIGMTQSTLSRRLTAEYPFNTAELEKIAGALNVPLRRILAPALDHERVAA